MPCTLVSAKEFNYADPGLISSSQVHSNKSTFAIYCSCWVYSANGADPHTLRLTRLPIWGQPSQPSSLKVRTAWSACSYQSGKYATCETYYLRHALLGVSGTAILITNATSRNLAASNHLTNQLGITIPCPLLYLTEKISIYMVGKSFLLSRSTAHSLTFLLHSKPCPEHHLLFSFSVRGLELV